MDAPNGTSSQARAALSRRMLLAAGGLVLLGGCARTDSAPPGLAAGRKPSRAQPPGAGPAVPGPVPTIPHRDEAVAHGHAAGARIREVPVAGEEPVYHIHDGPKAVALTIDDGPSPLYTPQILSLLHRYGITASFSMVGINVAAHPGVARAVATAGHLIVNHTWRHLNLALASPAEVSDEMAFATDAIHTATGRVPGMFRAPYGAWSPVVIRQCQQREMRPLDWSVDPRDWARPGVASIVKNIMRNTRTGSIILEHDGGGDRSQTVAALRIVLPRLVDAGYRFLTP